MTPRGERRIGVLVGIAVVVQLFNPAPAASQGVDDKRAQAARVQAQIDAQAERLAVLGGELGAAERKAGEADGAVRQAHADLAHADRSLSEARNRLASQGVSAYVSGNSTSALEQVVSSDGSDLHVRRQYLETAAGSQKEALDDLRAAREDLSTRRAQLEEALEQARATAEALAGQRDELAKGESDQRALLAGIQGELAQLLVAEQAHRNAMLLRQAEEAASARAGPVVVAAPGAKGPAPSGRPPTTGTAPGGMWSCIRQYESTSNYRAPRGGAYQIREPTWRSLGGTGRAEDADPATQDAMAVKLQQRSGWGQWPTVARRCGAL